MMLLQLFLFLDVQRWHYHWPPRISASIKLMKNFMRGLNVRFHIFILQMFAQFRDIHIIQRVVRLIYNILRQFISNILYFTIALPSPQLFSECWFSISTMGVFTACKMGKGIVNFSITTVCIDDLTIRWAIRYAPGCYLAAVHLIVSGMINSKVMVTHRSPSEKAQEAFETVEKGGKGVLTVLVEGVQRKWSACNTSSSLEKGKHLERNGQRCWLKVRNVCS